MSIVKAIGSELLFFLRKSYSFLYWNSKEVRITYSTTVSTKAKLNRCSFFGKSRILEEATVGKSTYGTDVFIQHAVVGDFCSLGPGCKIGLEEHDVDNYSTHPSTYDAKAFVKTRGVAVIGNHVWLGANVIVRQGVSIGDHSIVGAGAVVIRDIPSGEIWGGVPAKFLNRR